MLPEVGALEWLIIAAVALIVVGPKDLPMLLRRLGQFVAKLRGMASEFRASFDEMARQSELDDLRKEVDAMRKGQFLDMASHDELMKSTVGDIQQSLSDVGVDLNGGVEAFNYDDAIAQPPPPPPLTIAEGPKPVKKPRASRAKADAAKPVSTARVKAAPLVETPGRRKPKASKTVEAGS